MQHSIVTGDPETLRLEFGHNASGHNANVRDIVFTLQKK